MKLRALVLGAVAILLVLAIGSASAQSSLLPIEELGKLLYFDENLSAPAGMSCASCHHPDAGFADPDQDLPVSQGTVPTRFGNRNSPTAAYMSYSPSFYYDEDEEMYIGGQFWDGRADTLADQAEGPPLNPLEMKAPNKKYVVTQVKHSAYADLFMQVYGADAFKNADQAYRWVAEAIAAYEGTPELNQFSSKYDYYLRGQATLTDQEAWGLELFNAEDKGNCAACHPSEPGPYAGQALFTDYTYDNLGTPKNPNNPFYGLPKKFNPDGYDFVDYGLSGTTGRDEDMGKMKVPTLRNIAKTAPYMHNGVFTTLTEVVDYYNTRDVPGAGWPAPEVGVNINVDELGNLGLSADEVAAIVAFMETLTDGYQP